MELGHDERVSERKSRPSEPTYYLAVRLERTEPRIALGCFLSSWRAREDFHDIPYRIAKLSYSLKRFRNARKWILIDLQMHLNGASFLLLAKSCMQLGQWEQGLEALERAQALNANSERIADLRATCLLAMGKNEAAAKALAGKADQSNLSQLIAEILGVAVEPEIVRSIRSPLSKEHLPIVELHKQDRDAAIQKLLKFWV